MNYPKWWTDSITVYNRYFDSDGIAKYKSSVVTGCYFSTASAQTDSRGNTVISSGYTVRIRKDDNYINQDDWSSSSDYYTLRAGDIIVKGEKTDVIDDAIIGYTRNDFLKKYDNKAFVIKSYKENLKVELPHYWVTGE